MGRSIVIIDDSEGFRASAGRMLEDQGYTVLGEAGEGVAGVEVVLALQPDLAIVDVQLPDIDGFEVARRVCAGESPPAVVLVSSRGRSDFGSLVERSPALGFVPKEALSSDSIERLIP